MPMKVARITLVRAAENHYHHYQTKLKNLTQHDTLHYSGSPVQVLLSCSSGPCLAAHGKHLCLETHGVWARPTALIKNILIVMFV